MKDVTKASEILSNAFAKEEPASPHKVVNASSAVKEITSLNDKNFIRIAENLYAQADDFQKVWEVTTIDGKPYIVSKESSLLYKSEDYSVQESKTGVEIFKDKQFVDEIELSPTADTAAVIAQITDKINRVSFLPTSLVVEAMRKEASIASKKFIDTAKLQAIAAKDSEKKKIKTKKPTPVEAVPVSKNKDQKEPELKGKKALVSSAEKELEAEIAKYPELAERLPEHIRAIKDKHFSEKQFARQFIFPFFSSSSPDSQDIPEIRDSITSMFSSNPKQLNILFHIISTLRVNPYAVVSTIDQVRNMAAKLQDVPAFIKKLDSAISAANAIKAKYDIWVKTESGEIKGDKKINEVRELVKENKYFEKLQEEYQLAKTTGNEVDKNMLGLMIAHAEKVRSPKEKVKREAIAEKFNDLMTKIGTTQNMEQAISSVLTTKEEQDAAIEINRQVVGSIIDIGKGVSGVLSLNQSELSEVLGESKVKEITAAIKGILKSLEVKDTKTLFDAVESLSTLSMLQMKEFLPEIQKIKELIADKKIEDIKNILPKTEGDNLTPEQIKDLDPLRVAVLSYYKKLYGVYSDLENKLTDCIRVCGNEVMLVDDLMGYPLRITASSSANDVRNVTSALSDMLSSDILEYMGAYVVSKEESFAISPYLPGTSIGGKEKTMKLDKKLEVYAPQIDRAVIEAVSIFEKEKGWKIPTANDVRDILDKKGVKLSDPSVGLSISIADKYINDALDKKIVIRDKATQALKAFMDEIKGTFKPSEDIASDINMLLSKFQEYVQQDSTQGAIATTIRNNPGYFKDLIQDSMGRTATSSIKFAKIDFSISITQGIAAIAEYTAEIKRRIEVKKRLDSSMPKTKDNKLPVAASLSFIYKRSTDETDKLVDALKDYERKFGNDLKYTAGVYGELANDGLYKVLANLPQSKYHDAATWGTQSLARMLMVDSINFIKAMRVVQGKVEPFKRLMVPSFGKEEAIGIGGQAPNEPIIEPLQKSMQDTKSVAPRLKRAYYVVQQLTAMGGYGKEFFNKYIPLIRKQKYISVYIGAGRNMRDIGINLTDKDIATIIKDHEKDIRESSSSRMYERHLSESQIMFISEEKAAAITDWLDVLSKKGATFKTADDFLYALAFGHYTKAMTTEKEVKDKKHVVSETPTLVDFSVFIKDVLNLTVSANPTMSDGLEKILRNDPAYTQLRNNINNFVRSFTTIFGFGEALKELKGYKTPKENKNIIDDRAYYVLKGNSYAQLSGLQKVFNNSETYKHCDKDLKDAITSNQESIQPSFFSNKLRQELGEEKFKKFIGDSGARVLSAINKIIEDPNKSNLEKYTAVINMHKSERGFERALPTDISKSRDLSKFETALKKLASAIHMYTTIPEIKKSEQDSIDTLRIEFRFKMGAEVNRALSGIKAPIGKEEYSLADLFYTYAGLSKTTDKANMLFSQYVNLIKQEEGAEEVDASLFSQSDFLSMFESELIDAKLILYSVNRLLDPIVSKSRKLSEPTKTTLQKLGEDIKLILSEVVSSGVKVLNPEYNPVQFTDELSANTAYKKHGALSGLFRWAAKDVKNPISNNKEITEQDIIEITTILAQMTSWLKWATDEVQSLSDNLPDVSEVIAEVRATETSKVKQEAPVEKPVDKIIKEIPSQGVTPIDDKKPGMKDTVKDWLSKLTAPAAPSAPAMGAAAKDTNTNKLKKTN